MKAHFVAFAGPFAILVAFASCVPGGRGTGLGAPNLVGTYELSGPYTRDGADPGVTYHVTFRPDGFYEYEEVGQIGPPPPPARYQTSGDYVTFTVAGRDFRVWRRVEGLAAEVRGRYVVNTRTEQYCAQYKTDENGRRYCARYRDREIHTYGNYAREVAFRRLTDSG